MRVILAELLMMHKSKECFKIIPCQDNGQLAIFKLLKILCSTYCHHRLFSKKLNLEAATLV